jgi:hypothetical protein
MLKGKALYYVKLALRVHSYFQVLDLFKIFQREVHPTLIKQELQTIKGIEQHTSITDKLIKIVKLSMWWLPQTSDTHIRESRPFESMYTLQGEIRLTRHTLSMLDSRMVPDHTSSVVCIGNHSLVPTRPKQTPTPGRSLTNRRQTGPAFALGHLILPPSWQPWSRGERFHLSGYTATSAY